jgi:hypothetical protein
MISTIVCVVPSLTPAAMTRLKSPATGMHFTQGLPIRMVADGIDENGWQWLDQQMEAEEVHFIVDGTPRDTDGHSRGYNHFECIITGLSTGTHVLTTESVNYGNIIAHSDVPVTITIDPLPAKQNTVNLSADLQLTGAQDLDWENAVVHGNGHRVTSAANWSGSVIIRNSFVTGLAVAGTVVPDSANSVQAGIDVSTTGGSVDIEGSTFEWTGADFFVVNGSGSVTVRGNEFRANAFIGYVSYNPDRSPFMHVSGSASGAKVFQGNNVGAGYLYITNMGSWLIGGDDDAQSNVFIGPRTGPRLEGCSGAVLRGNYSHHDYHGGWSQGFNFDFYNTSGFLIEHNVIYQGSWPVQSISGEFRYNLVVECGHEWLRTAEDGTRIHHNIFVNPVPAGDPAAGIWLYLNHTGIQIYNNDFDGGNHAGWFDFPAVSVSDGSMVSSLRNNVFTGFSDPATRGIVDRYVSGGESDSVARLQYTDYNCFYNPLTATANNYGNGLASGATEGAAGYGGHDLGGVNGQVNPTFVQGIDIPYSVNEADVWNRVTTVSQVLAQYRSRYTPGVGSLLIDAGDPADGAGVDIGAVGAGVDEPLDQFGKFGTPASVRRNYGRLVIGRDGVMPRRPASTFDLHGRLVGQTPSSPASRSTSGSSMNRASARGVYVVTGSSHNPGSAAIPHLIVK